MEIFTIEYRLAWKELDMQKVGSILKEQQKTVDLFNNEQDYHQLEGKLNVRFTTMGKTRTI